jgi:hypothetical protein
MSVATESTRGSHFMAQCAAVHKRLRKHQHQPNPKKNMKRIIITVAALAISAIGIQAADAAKGEKKKPDPEAAWAKVSGGKESVTKEEFASKAKDKAKAEATFDKKDADKDGKLTKAEFTAHGKKAK